MTHYFVVIGRLHGDDQDQCRCYEGDTVDEARQEFINDLRHDAGISEDDVVAEYEFTNAYIAAVMCSETPITVW